MTIFKQARASIQTRVGNARIWAIRLRASPFAQISRETSQTVAGGYVPERHARSVVFARIRKAWVEEIRFRLFHVTQWPSKAFKAAAQSSCPLLYARCSVLAWVGFARVQGIIGFLNLAHDSGEALKADTSKLSSLV